MRTRTLILFILLLILWAYYQYYSATRKDFNILQVYLDTLTTRQLYEKYPILIYDRIVQPDALLSTLFKYLYTSRKFLLLRGGPQPYLTPFKYTLLHNPTQDTQIHLIHPSHRRALLQHARFAREKGIWRYPLPLQETKVTYVTVKLKKQQILILPPFWLFQTTAPMHAIALHDPISHLVDLLHRWGATSA
jgi:hypothetical protein